MEETKIKFTEPVIVTPIKDLKSDDLICEFNGLRLPITISEYDEKIGGYYYNIEFKPIENPEISTIDKGVILNFTNTANVDCDLNNRTKAE